MNFVTQVKRLVTVATGGDEVQTEITPVDQDRVHRFELGAKVRYRDGDGPVLVVLQRITRESRRGVELSYRCRQILNGQLLGQRLEVDESELQMRED